jgi:hypothetical protein
MRVHAMSEARAYSSPRTESRLDPITPLLTVILGRPRRQASTEHAARSPNTLCEASAAPRRSSVRRDWKIGGLGAGEMRDSAIRQVRGEDL